MSVLGVLGLVQLSLTLLLKWLKGANGYQPGTARAALCVIGFLFPFSAQDGEIAQRDPTGLTEYEKGVIVCKKVLIKSKEYE